VAAPSGGIYIYIYIPIDVYIYIHLATTWQKFEAVPRRAGI
jgi:hypothetical protein